MRPSTRLPLRPAAAKPTRALATPALPPATYPEREEAPRIEAPNFDFLKRSEFWLNKVGIGLLLLGLAFFFKYSIDRGWLNEPVRVALGLVLGTVLLGFGLWVHSNRRHFSQVLLGGSIATYYITGYAAYELFDLVPYEIAFGFMGLVTALAFALAVRQDESILALIGVVGGLLTPFVLTGPSGDAVGLVTYTCIVLAGTGAIYLYRGWRSLLWVGFVGGWLVFGAGLLSQIFATDTPMSSRWALQAAALFALVAFWGVPVLREALYQANPQRWPRPTLEERPEFSSLVNTHVFLLTITLPLMTLAYSWLVWESMVTKAGWGWASVALAAVFGVVAWLLRERLPRLAYTHALMGVLLLTLGVVQIFEGDALIVALAIEAAALHFVSRRVSDLGTAIAGHLIAAPVTVWLAGRMLITLLAEPAFTGADLTNLAVIVLLAAASFAVWPEVLRVLYRNIVHVGVMGWLFAQLYDVSYWPGLVMLSWAAYAIALYAATRRWPTRFGRADAVVPTHVIFSAAILMFALRVANGQAGDWVVLNLNTLIDAALVAMLVGMSFFVAPRQAVSVYRVAAHFVVLALLWRELSVIPDGLVYVMLSWAIYGLGMHYLSTRLPDKLESADLSLAANVPFVGVAAWFTWGLTTQTPLPAVFNLPALISLACIGITVGASFFARQGQAPLVYRLSAYLAGLGWLWHEFSVLPNGEGYTALAWAALAAGLLYLTRRLYAQGSLECSRYTAAATVTFGAVGLWFTWGLMTGIPDVPVFNLPAFLWLACIGLALGASFLIRSREVALAYWLGAYVAAMSWLWHELSLFANGDGYVVLAWSALAAGLLYLAHRVERLDRLEKSAFTVVASLTFAIVALWTGPRLTSPVGYDTPVLNPAAISDLLVIGLAVGSAYLLEHVRMRWVFLLLSHMAFLTWLWRELGALENGNAYITTAWGAYGIALLVAGLSNRSGKQNMPIVYAGIATLLLVVGKLFLIDLSALDPLWRVLLFIGFGGVFLLLSYYFQNVIRGKPGAAGKGAGKWLHWLHWPRRPAH